MEGNDNLFSMITFLYKFHYLPSESLDMANMQESRNNTLLKNVCKVMQIERTSKEIYAN